MRFRLLVFLALLLAVIFTAVPASGQSTTVSGTITDAAAQAWINGTYRIEFYQGSANPPFYWNGAPFPNPPVFTGNLDNTGSFSGLSIPSNNFINPPGSQWKFTVCPASTSPCFTQPVAISGASQNVSSSIVPPAIQVQARQYTQPTAYADSEIVGPIPGFVYFNLVNNILRQCNNPLPCTWTNAGGGTSTTSAGPIINCLTFGCSSTLSDNATQFAAATAAYNAASLTAGNPAVKNSAQNNCNNSPGCTSIVVTINIAVGDTVVVFANNIATGRTVTITDSGPGGNQYQQFVPMTTNGSSIGIFATPLGGATAAATSVTVAESGAASAVGAVVITFSNVGSYRFLGTETATGSSTTPAISVASTQDTNNIFVSAYAWFTSAQTISASANTGTLQQTFSSTPNLGGEAVVTQLSASPAALTNNVTLGASSTWVATGIELRSRTLVRPILYIPPGFYTYSSGLNFTQPGTLMCTPGTATLNYIGTAHAVDMGATLTTSTKNSAPIGVDGCDFTSARGTMTDGIVFNDWNVLNYVQRSSFRNFGNAAGTSRMIAGFCDNWDMEIGPQNKFITTDMIPTIIFQDNTGCSNNRNSFVRIHDNIAACWQGDAVNGAQLGCIGSQAGPGFILDGAQQRVWHNNLAFWSPVIRFTCQADFCYGNQVDNNILESAAGAGTDNTIQFGGNQNGMLVTQNAVTTQNSTGGFIGPVGGSDILSGARINFNTLNLQPAATPVVKMNNLTGQTGNFSFSNNCSVNQGDSTFLPCPIMHTAGANIAQWGADQYPSCTMVSGTCSYSFTVTYTVAPRCVGVWNGSGTFTTGASLKVVSTTTTVAATSSTGTDTAVVQFYCSAGDSQ